MFVTVTVQTLSYMNLRPRANSKLIETPGGLVVRVTKRSEADELNSKQVPYIEVFTDLLY